MCSTAYYLLFSLAGSEIGLEDNVDSVEDGVNELVGLQDMESVSDSDSEESSCEVMVFEDSGSDVELVEVDMDDDEEDEGDEWLDDLQEDKKETNIEHEEEALYNGAPITVSASYLMLFFYAKKFGLTLEGFQGLLEVVRNHCPKPNKCASSVYKLKSFFSKKFGNVENHEKRRYCSVCCNYIEDGGGCLKQGCAGKDKTPIEFYCNDVTPQLKQRMEGKCSTGLRSLIYT